MKALASRKRSWPTSSRSFFYLRRPLAQTGELVGDAHKLLGQFFKALVVGDQRFEVRGLLGGNAFGELLALDVALEHVVRPLLGLGAGAVSGGLKMG